MEISLNENYKDQEFGNDLVSKSNQIIKMEYQKIDDSIDMKIKWKEKERG